MLENLYTLPLSTTNAVGTFPWDKEFNTDFVEVNHSLEDSLTSFCHETAITCSALNFRLAEYRDDLYEDFQIGRPAQLHCWLDKRKAEYLAGRLAVARLLKSSVPIGTGKNREPLWPESMNGSISHDGFTSVAAVSPADTLVGIDIEPIVDDGAMAWLTDSVLNENECRLIQAFRRNVLATAIFSAKECFFKAMYPLVKAYFDFNVLQCSQVTEKQLIFEIQSDFKNQFDVRLGNTIAVDWFLTPNKEVVTVIKVLSI